MGVVNAELLKKNLERVNGLSKVGLSAETIASASRDKTGLPITTEDIESFQKVGNIASRQMLITANQGKKLTQFAQGADTAAENVVDSAKEKSKADEPQIIVEDVTVDLHDDN